MSDALQRLCELGAHNTVTTDEERGGSVFHYHLPEGREIVVYPLLFGQGLLCTGRIDRDHWDRGYMYKSIAQAVDAAQGWINPDQPPPGDWTREELHGSQ